MSGTPELGATKDAMSHKTSTPKDTVSISSTDENHAAIRLRAAITAKLSAGGCLTVGEAAMYLAVHAETIRRALRRGTLKGVRPQGHGEWRILPCDLAGYIGVPLALLAANGTGGRESGGGPSRRGWRSN